METPIDLLVCARPLSPGYFIRKHIYFARTSHPETRYGLYPGCRWYEWFDAHDDSHFWFWNPIKVIEQCYDYLNPYPWVITADDVLLTVLLQGSSVHKCTFVAARISPLKFLLDTGFDLYKTWRERDEAI